MTENTKSICNKRILCALFGVFIITLIIGLVGGYFGHQLLSTSETASDTVIGCTEKPPCAVKPPNKEFSEYLNGTWHQASSKNVPEYFKSLGIPAFVSRIKVVYNLENKKWYYSVLGYNKTDSETVCPASYPNNDGTSYGARIPISGDCL